MKTRLGPQMAERFGPPVYYIYSLVYAMPANNLVRVAPENSIGLLTMILYRKLI